MPSSRHLALRRRFGLSMSDKVASARPVALLTRSAQKPDIIGRAISTLFRPLFGSFRFAKRAAAAVKNPSGQAPPLADSGRFPLPVSPPL